MRDRAQILLRKMVPNIYSPRIVSIGRIEEETSDIKTFTLRFKEEKEENRFVFKPGQFTLVSVFGCGEAPISISSSPTLSDGIQLSIKKVGLLTSRIHEYAEKDEIGVRGPYGNGFPVDRLQGNDLLFVGGGIGLAPLRSLIQYVLADRDAFGAVTILYGARTPADIVFKSDLAAWAKEDNVRVLVTVDRGDEQWTGETGPVTHLWDKTSISPADTRALICGPPIMISYVVFDLLKMGFAEDDIISTLERHMKCGVGKCGHCSIGSKFICLDGPVFTYREMKTLPPLL